MLGSGSSARADPISDFLDPTPDPAQFLPTPLGDPWFDPPAGFANARPGTVLHTRGVSVPRIPTPARATQLLFRTTDSKNRPVAAATTVLVPNAPWTGGGPRPVVSYNIAIDSLGNTCAPSYTYPRGNGAEIDNVSDLLARNVAVVVPDYEGPRQAYSAGLMSGHAVLDSIRAAVTDPALGLSPAAPVGITGYSGGAIASGWAAQLAPSYAPELKIAGVAFGGAPTDYNLLHESLNGKIGSGLYLAAATGLAREYPELLRFSNANGFRVMQLQKDQCAQALSISGVFMLPAEAIASDPNAAHDPLLLKVIAENRMGASAPTAPIYIYQGIQDDSIPKLGPENLQRDWCGKGASVHLLEMPGDHSAVSQNGVRGAFDWLSAQLSGRAASKGCSTEIR